MRKLWAMYVVQQLISNAAMLLYSYVGSYIINSFQHIVHKEAIKTICSSGKTSKKGNWIQGELDTTLTTSNADFLERLESAVMPGFPVPVKIYGAAKLKFWINCKCKFYSYYVVPYTKVQITIDNITKEDTFIGNTDSSPPSDRQYYERRHFYRPI